MASAAVVDDKLTGSALLFFFFFIGLLVFNTVLISAEPDLGNFTTRTLAWLSVTPSVTKKPLMGKEMKKTTKTETLHV